jgi:hypothetical protein
LPKRQSKIMGLLESQRTVHVRGVRRPAK